MNKKLQNILITSGLILVTIFVVKRCEKEPKIKIETVYVKKTDTITQTIIDTAYQIKYVTRIKTLKGVDSIVYVEKDAKTPMRAIRAKEYDAVVKTDSSRADLKVLTTGELLSITGTISYDQKQTTITKIKPKSGAFMYVETNHKFNRYEMGLDYQLRNKIVIGTSVYYDNLSKQAGVGFKLGFRVF